MEAPVDEFLFTVAEVAAAFAGFAGLVTVLTQRLARTQRDFDIARFRDMLLLSLIVVAFSLLPAIASGFAASEEIRWRVSALLFLIAWAGFGLQGVYAGVRLTQSGSRPFARPLFWNNLAVHLGAMTALILVAVDASVVENARAAVYLAALFAMLYLAGAYLMALFLSLVRE